MGQSQRNTIISERYGGVLCSRKPIQVIFLQLIQNKKGKNILDTFIELDMRKLT
jgi:hypothetical protein